MNRTAILQQASSLINGERQEQHGAPAESFARIAAMWSGYCGFTFAPHDVCAMLALLKIARTKAGPKHEDSWIDGAGYLALGGELAE